MFRVRFDDDGDRHDDCRRGHQDLCYARLVTSMMIVDDAAAKRHGAHSNH